MMVYEIKLICPGTKEVIYHSVASKAQLPPHNLYDRLPRPLLVISIKDSSAEDVKKVA